MYNYKYFDECILKLTVSNNNKLHILYGEGGTGKTTFLNHFVNDIIGKDNVLMITLDDMKRYKHGRYRPRYQRKDVKVNEMYIVISADDDVEDIIKEYIKYGDKTKKYITTTIMIPDDLNYNDRIELTHFTHKFV